MNYKTTRYPRSKRRGEGVARAWLLSQLPNAKRPNALIDVALSPLHPWAIAAACKVTEDVLIDFFLGKDELSECELCALGAILAFDGENLSQDYLLKESLSVLYDDEREEHVSSAKTAMKRMDKRHPVYNLLPGLFEMDPTPWSATTTPWIFADMPSDYVNYGNRIKPRSSPIINA